MFKRSRVKIVAAIMFVLVLLLFGTFCVIYISSYVDVTNENREMLRQYVDSYRLPGTDDPGTGTNDPGAERGRRGLESRPDMPPMAELSTFYTVAISNSGEVLNVDTADISAYSEDQLTELAEEIMDDGKSEGIKKNLIYQMEEKDGYTLVAFLDNTVVLQSAGTLFTYTLIFGSAALIIVFFLARYLADRIVAPMEESYQRQKQFISDAGHELKTPVAVVNANVEILSRETGENQWLSNIRYENERMSALISQLLELAKTENTVPPMEQTDFGRLIYGETLPFESVAFENGLTLKTDIASDVRVRGNSTQLRQLTSILIDNAIRHGEKGKEVALFLKKERGSAVLSVINDGEEIPPEQQKHLFERFYRTDEARTDGGGHYGLGLAIAKAITITHKGMISVRCYDGKVEFTVKIPLQK